ncbi:hypothetical protein PMKS-000612 [Pichia membranifaciens]|uniref:Structural maintenance of chromosomes protein 5 n=1 Tax=Pichia membranifaciens TaxID=4926 RepID=A0A1Q2YCC1_9ASCO|nr:hypothetical protein PMKS-000612 [Pichia membranifaciens]
MTQICSLGEGLPVPKRLKSHFTPNYNAFQPGSIIRCKLSNFMSYALTEFHFGPRMNLIIGPNGSGKSTFVCAVCIGLGGKLSNLGKESMITDGFIKDNKDEARIELELKAFENDSGLNSVIIATKLLRNRKTLWEINHRPASENDIKKLLRSFNIQLDNLCQFLPQDRVSKFADLKSEDLLKEIERSYKNGELLGQHNLIVRLQSTINQEEKTFNESREILLELKVKNDALKEKVEKHRHYLKLKKDLEKTEMIRPYVKLQDKKNEMVILKQSFDVERDTFTQFQEKVKPIEESLKSSDEALNEVNESIKDLDISNLKVSKDLKSVESRIEKLDGKTKEYLSTMKEYDSKLLRTKEEYFKLRDDFHKIEDDLKKLDLVDDNDVQEWKHRRLALKNEFLEFDDIITGIKSKANACERKLDSIKGEIILQQQRLNSKDRLNTIDYNRYRVSIQAVQALRKLKQSNPDFPYKFSEPALVTLNVKNTAIAPIVEALIPFSHLNAIVVPTKSDYNGLSRFLYDERKLMVSMRTLGEKFDVRHDQIPNETIKRLGFDGYISDFLTGPEEVIQMLCENVYLHRIPVSIKGLSASQKDTINREIEKGLGLVKYVSHDEIYTMNRSSYGRRQVTTNIKSFKLRSFIFQNGLSEEQKKIIGDKLQELNQEYATVENTVKELKRDISERQENYKDKRLEFNKYEEDVRRAGHIRREETKLKQRLQMAEERMVVKKKAIKSVKHSNSGANRQKIYEKIDCNLNEKMHLQRTDKRELLIKKMANDTSLILLKIKRIEESNKVESIKELHMSIKEEKDEKLQKLESLKASYRKAKKHYQESLERYKNKVSEYSVEDKEDMKQIIEEMAEKEILNEEGLNTRIDKIKSEMQLNNRSGGEVSLKQLEENEEKINSLDSSIPEMEQSIARHKEELGEMTKSWESELDKIVSMISSDFGDNMNQIASAGDVKLDKSDSDYSKWKLIIQVSFRDNEELSNFNGAQHSGGEKSTTTAVFLNSLQGLTNTPFRVVDEINQGMDARNERKAHELIVKKATSGHVKASQYFLITPKLLTDLYYGPSMTVHCIFAGRWCPGCEDDLPYLEMGVTAKYAG